eukprot:3753580-Rhodomonas_salina.1
MPVPLTTRSRFELEKLADPKQLGVTFSHGRARTAGIVRGHPSGTVSDGRVPQTWRSISCVGKGS